MLTVSINIRLVGGISNPCVDPHDESESSNDGDKKMYDWVKCDDRHGAFVQFESLDILPEGGDNTWYLRWWQLCVKTFGGIHVCI